METAMIVRKDLTEADVIARLFTCFEDYNVVSDMIKKAKKEHVHVANNIVLVYDRLHQTFTTVVQIGSGYTALEAPSYNNPDSINYKCVSEDENQARDKSDSDEPYVGSRIGKKTVQKVTVVTKV